MNSTAKIVNTPCAAHVGAVDDSQCEQQDGEDGPASASNVPETLSMRSGEVVVADQEVEIEVEQRPEAVLGFSGTALGMLDIDLAEVGGETVRERGNVGAALAALQHRVE